MRADVINRLSAVFQGQCAIVSSINDRNDWKTVKNALQIMNIDEINTKVCGLHVFLQFVIVSPLYFLPGQDLFGIIASVLHLGNVCFDPDSTGQAVLRDSAELHWVSNVSKTQQTTKGFRLFHAFHVIFPCSCWGWMLPVSKRG